MRLLQIILVLFIGHVALAESESSTPKNVSETNTEILVNQSPPNTSLKESSVDGKCVHVMTNLMTVQPVCSFDWVRGEIVYMNL